MPPSGRLVSRVGNGPPAGSEMDPRTEKMLTEVSGWATKGHEPQFTLSDTLWPGAGRLHRRHALRAAWKAISETMALGTSSRPLDRTSSLARLLGADRGDVSTCPPSRLPPTVRVSSQPLTSCSVQSRSKLSRTRKRNGAVWATRGDESVLAKSGLFVDVPPPTWQVWLVVLTVSSAEAHRARISRNHSSALASTTVSLGLSTCVERPGQTVLRFRRQSPPRCERPERPGPKLESSKLNCEIS